MLQPPWSLKFHVPLQANQLKWSGLKKIIYNSCLFLHIALGCLKCTWRSTDEIKASSQIQIRFYLTAKEAKNQAVGETDLVKGRKKEEAVGSVSIFLSSFSALRSFFTLPCTSLCQETVIWKRQWHGAVKLMLDLGLTGRVLLYRDLLLPPLEVNDFQKSKPFPEPRPTAASK